jgi:hypothetical protein
MSGTTTTEPLSVGDDLVAAAEATNKDVVRLAVSISLAVRVEPGLLRRARLLHPGLSAATEADLWFSPLVESKNWTGFTLLPEVRTVLQERLGRQPSELNRAWSLVEEAHRDSPQLLQVEERLAWLALRGDADDRIGEHLGEIVAAMVSDAERGKGLARWAARALPGLPARLRSLDQLWMLALGASARLGGRRVIRGHPPAHAIDSWLPIVIPADSPSFRVGVRFLPAGIEISEPPFESAQSIDVPAMNPIVLEMREGSGGHVRQINLDLGETVVLEVGSGEIYLRTAAGDVYLLTMDLKTELFREGPLLTARYIADFSDERTRVRPLFVAEETARAQQLQFMVQPTAWKFTSR